MKAKSTLLVLGLIVVASGLTAPATATSRGEVSHGRETVADCQFDGEDNYIPLSSLSLDADSVDVTDGQASIRATGIVMDPDPGRIWLEAWATGQRGQGTRLNSLLADVTAIDEHQSTFTATFIVPRFVASGEWRVLRVGCEPTCLGGFSHGIQNDAAKPTFIVTSQHDRTRPEVRSLRFERTKVDTRRRAQVVPFAGRVYDDLSGFASTGAALQVTLYAYNGLDRILRLSLRSRRVSFVGQRFQGFIRFPKGLGNHRWKVWQVLAYDRAGNDVEYGGYGRSLPRGLRETIDVKSRNDTVAPRVRGATITPASISPLDDRRIRIEVRFGPDMSGIAEATFELWRRGTRRDSWSGGMTPVRGAWKYTFEADEQEYWMTCTSATPDTYVVAVYAFDGAGNRSALMRTDASIKLVP